MSEEIALLAENSQFTVAEREQIDKIKQELDLTSSVSSVEYGIGCQRQLAEFADKVLENSSKGITDTSELLQSLVEEIKGLDAGAAIKDTFWSRIPIIGSRARRMKKLKKRFSKAKVRIELLENELERSRMELLRGAELFNVLIKENAKCFRQLNVYIQAGKERLEHIKSAEIPKLAAQTQNDPMSAQMLNDYETNLAQFENRIQDLEISRTIALQSAPQMKIIQSGNAVMAQKIQSAVLNTIPVWKNQYATAVGLSEQTSIYKTQREIDKVTNAMVQRNAEMLRQSAVQTAVESRRGGIDTNALKKANDNLVAVIEETLKLNRESAAKHRQAETDLGNIEHQLQEALSQVK